MVSFKCNYEKRFEKDFSDIEDLKKELRSLSATSVIMHYRERFRFIADFIYNSNKIDGNSLTLKETKDTLLYGEFEDKLSKDQIEAIGHRDAYNYIEGLAYGIPEKGIKPNNDILIDESIIRKIHSFVLMDKPENAGVYRKQMIEMKNSKYTPTEPLFIDEEINKIIDEYNNSDNTLHILEKIVWFHLKFECIHPFIDGNGRTGRLIMNLMLMQNSYPPIIIKYKDVMKYFDSFKDFSSKNEGFKLMDIVIKGIKESLKKLIVPRVKVKERLSRKK